MGDKPDSNSNLATPAESDGFTLTYREKDMLLASAAGILSAAVAYQGYKDFGRPFYKKNIDLPHAVSLSDPRERMARSLIHRGHASIDEILEASYGEWPPKGLDIVTDNPQKVGFGKIPEHMNALGSAQQTDDRIIRLNHTRLSTLPRLAGKSAFNSTLGHEGIHILQGDNFYRAEEIYGYKRPRMVWQEQMVSNGFGFVKDPSANLFSEHMKEGFTSKLSTPQLKTFNYLRTGPETQARVHEIAMDGYQRWGQLPANREQLLVAMKNSGLDIPNSVMQGIEHSPTIEETKSIFSSNASNNKFRAIDEVKQINLVQAGLTDAGKVEYWNKAMPELYSDLIEMYGDGPGRERFDLGKNLRPGLRANMDDDKIILATPKEATEAAFADNPDLDNMLKPGAQIIPDVPKTPGFWSKAADSLNDMGGKSGFIAGTALGTVAGVATYIATGDKAQAAEVAFETIVPYGETALDIADGDMDAAAHSGTVETAAIAGSFAGAATGAATGAAIGSVVPVIGTGVGAVAGGIIGGIGGGVTVGMTTDYILENGQEIIDTTMTAIDDVGATISEAASISLDAVAQHAKETWSGITNIFSDEANPKTEIALDSGEVRNSLQNLSEDQVATMSPEIQSLYQYREHSELFEKQFEELKEHGGLEEVATEMETIQEEATAQLDTNIPSTENNEEYTHSSIGYGAPAMT